MKIQGSQLSKRLALAAFIGTQVVSAQRTQQTAGSEDGSDFSLKDIGILLASAVGLLVVTGGVTYCAAKYCPANDSQEELGVPSVIEGSNLVRDLSDLEDPNQNTVPNLNTPPELTAARKKLVEMGKHRRGKGQTYGQPCSRGKNLFGSSIDLANQ